MNYYQHHIGDFIRDTSRLTDSQCMAYLRLIWMYYDNEQPLPNNPRILAFKVGATVDDVSLILEAFFVLDDAVWRHSRCDAEIADYWKFCEAQKAKGKKGGRPKKNPTETQEKPEENPPGFRREADGNPEQSPENPNHYPLTNTSITDVIDGGAKPKREVKRSVPLPADFYPNDTGIRYAEERRINVAVELTSFTNWHKAKGTTLKDWQAGWRTWCDKAVEFGRAGISAPAKTQHQINQEATARAFFGSSSGSNEPRLISGEVVE